MLNKSTNDIGTSSAISNTEFFDKEKVSKHIKTQRHSEELVKEGGGIISFLNFLFHYLSD